MNISNLDRFTSGLVVESLTMVSNGVTLSGEAGCFILEKAVDDKYAGMSWVTEWLTSR